MQRHLFRLALFSLPLALLAGCRKSATSGPPAAGGAADWPPGLFLAAEPPGASDLAEAIAGAADGAAVTLRARVGGRRDPFVQGAAAMTVADPSLPPCNERHGDWCPTPWDYCCEPPDVKATHTAVVVVPGPDGSPIRSSLAGAGGLDPLNHIVIQGTVKRGPDGKGLTIRATGIFVRSETTRR